MQLPAPMQLVNDNEHDEHDQTQQHTVTLTAEDATGELVH